MTEKTGHAHGQKNGITIGQAAAFHLATIPLDHLGESVETILHEVKAFVPQATKPDLIKALQEFAGKKFLRLKPDEFVQVHNAGKKHFEILAQSVA